MIHRRLIDWIRKRYLRRFVLISLVIILVAAVLAFGMAVQISDNVEKAQLNQVSSDVGSQSQYITQWAEGKEVYLTTFSAHIESLIQVSNANQDGVSGLSGGVDVTAGDDAMDYQFSSEEEFLTSNNSLQSNVSVLLRNEVRNQSGSLEAFYLVRKNQSTPRKGEVESSSSLSSVGDSTSEIRLNLGETSDGQLLTFNNVTDSDVFVTWVYERDGNKYISFITPVFEERYLIGEYNLSSQANGIQQNVIRRNNDSNTYILGGVSAYVMFGNSSTSGFYPYAGQQNATKIGQEILNRDQVTKSLSGAYIGEQKVKGYQSVSHDKIDWVIVREVPQEQALAITRRVQLDLVYLISIMFLGFVATAVSARRSLVVPIRDLLETLRGVSRGDTDVENVSSNRIDEIGELYDIAEEITEQHIIVSNQARAISQQEFYDEAFEKSVPGELGQSLQQMKTELQRYIDRLQSEQKRYSRLVEQNVHSIAVIQDDRFVYTNDQFVEMTGYDKSELLSIDPRDVIFPYTDAFIDRALVKLTQDDFDDSDEIYRETVRLKRASGERRTVELSASQIEHLEEPAVIISLRDITDRDRVQKRLQVFNRVLRHNIRSNIQVITAGLDSIPDEYTSKELELARKHIDKTLSTTNKARMIGNLLDEYQIQSVSICDPLKDTVKRARKEFPGATITLECSDEVEVVIPTPFEEAIWELLENAIVHTGDEARVDISVQSTKRFAVVSVEDNGPGMPRREWKPLVEEEQTQLKHGSGLGLWFVKWTLDIVGGSIDVTIDDGTRVSAFVPLTDSDTSVTENNDFVDGGVEESIDVEFDVGLDEEGTGGDSSSSGDDTGFDWVDFD